MKNLIFIALVVFAFSTLSVPAQSKTENVILITLDGARLQEMFGGLDADIFRSADKNFEKNATFKKFQAATPIERREKLMPFFWTELMKNHGSIAGNRSLNSIVKTTNKHFFSYPGYSELVTGEARDSIINTNSFGQNRWPSFLNFLEKKMNLSREQVAVFGSWDAIEQISTNDPNAFVVNSGPKGFGDPRKELAELNEAVALTIGPAMSVRPDYFTYRFALDQMKRHHPRAMFISFGETDDWAHQRDYEKYLQSWHNTDAMLKGLWTLIQSDKRYRGKTSIIITIDHGRGNSGKDWSDHGEDVPEAQYIWMAFLSPDLPMRGEWKDSPEIYQNQVAATLVKLMGFDYTEQNPNAGKPIGRLFGMR
ncbi:MAG: phosphoglyceromutase [Pyrinomonadaceae bacterium]